MVTDPRIGTRSPGGIALTMPAAAKPTPARRKIADAPICLLPGPVALAPAVQAALREPIVYHRAEEFLPLFEGVRKRLSGIVGGKPVGLFVGSGTLANDVVAATLNADPARDNGLILVSGEFGERLLKQARNWNLNPRVINWAWGQPWNLADIEATLKTMPAGGWIWGTHHETSTGVLNDLPGLFALAKKYGQRVCVDCVSSLATVPLNLNDAYLATGASGKAVGSYAGIAFVFADPAQLAHLDQTRIPTYLDIAATISTYGPRFTVPSPLIMALDAAIEALDTPAKRAARYQHIADLGAHLRSRLEEAGFAPLSPAAISNPAIITFAPPAGETTADFVGRCREWGYQIAGQSGYLAERRLVQIAIMGNIGQSDLDPLLDNLVEV